jgi:hypothetical protein
MQRNKVDGKLLTAERRSVFNKKFRDSAVHQARRQRDAETRRMEEYRRLCAKEGIQSKRLAEYDAKKQARNAAIDEALKQVDESTLSAAEKKRKKFSIKRKVATVNLTAANAPNLLATKMENAAKARLEAIQTQRDEAARKSSEKLAAQDRRRARNALFAQRTSKGQPVMRSRIEALLHKAQM